MGDDVRRYWLDERRGYVPLDEFPRLLLALRDAGDPGWHRRHPPEPTVTERAREIVERGTRMPAYLADDETWDAAMARAEAERDLASSSPPVSEGDE